MTTIKNKKQTPFATGVYYANGDKTIKEKQIRQALPIFPEATMDNANIHYKSNSYYFDLNDVIGGRPNIIKHNTDEPQVLTAKGINPEHDFRCAQPLWNHKCV